ncbi:MAG TPA: hypothetical protein VJX67_18785 [Blastocatellia bacterium]|nr:hypothetical protein [Blastocatellia bacterium]
MNILLIAGSILELVTRVYMACEQWRTPLKNGERFFLAQSVEPRFYQGAGAGLLRRFRLSLLIPLALDTPLSLGLFAAHKYGMAIIEQWLALIVTVVFYNLILAHFSSRARNLAKHPEERQATAVQLSMSPRRLRDHTSLVVELVVAATMLLALGVLARNYALARTASASHTRGSFVHGAGLFVIWTLYLQLGMLLLKVVFVRWRMPLPVNRAGDFRRWRGAWLRWHLKLLDSLRVLVALGLPWGILIKTYASGWTRTTGIISAGWWLPVMAGFLVHISREGRRLKAVVREVNPVELVKEFPRPAVPDGRFLAGGLLFFNRDNPATVVRSLRGIAINLAVIGPYAWVGYFIGLAILTAWLMTNNLR